MKKYFTLKNLTMAVILISAIFFAIMFFRGCGRSIIPEPVHTTTTKYIAGDKSPYFIWMEKQFPIFIDTGYIQYFPSKIDTTEIIKDYFSKKHFEITAKDDTSMLVKVFLNVFKNGLDSLWLEVQNRRKTAIITTTNSLNPAPVNKFFIGVSGAYDFTNSKPVVGVSALLVSKGLFGYELSANTAGIVSFGIHYKLSLKRK